MRLCHSTGPVWLVISVINRLLFLLLQVADSKGHTLFRKDDATKGKFAFTTEDYDMFEVCFKSVATGVIITWYTVE